MSDPSNAIVLANSASVLASTAAVVVASNAAVLDHSGARTDEEMVELWLAGRPETTRRAYRRDAGRLLAFLRGRGRGLRDATLADVQAYVALLQGAPASQARGTSIIKSLLTDAHECGYCAFNVGKKIRSPKVPNELAERILPEELTMRLLGAPLRFRDRVLLRLLYVVGCRVSEAVALDCKHVQARERGLAQVTLHGKGVKTRHVLVTERCAGELARLCDGVGPDEPVFRTRSGRRLGVRNARRIVARATRLAGIDARVSPHWLRHAHASHALDRGAPAHLVQADLGHADLRTTSKYVHARPGDGSARYLGA